MVKYYTILTGKEVTLHDLSIFLSQIAGSTLPDENGVGRVSNGLSDVWINLDKHPDILYETDLSEQDSITRKLGVPPKSGLTLCLSRQPGTNSLVTKIAIAAAEAWGAILWDDTETNGIMYDLPELRQMLKDGKDLPGG